MTLQTRKPYQADSAERADPLAAARRAGLRWVNTDEPGLTRRAHATGFGWRDAHGRVVRDPEVLERLRALVIPPAWQNVWACADADGHIQATGRDARGRKQYRYHARWQVERGQTKFEHLLAFSKVLPRVRARVQGVLRVADREHAPTRENVLATLVQLLDTTALRVGNTGYARDNGSFGLTTLRNRHVRIARGTVELSFQGKSGVRQAAALTDPRVARVLARCRELPGQELFQFVDEAGQLRKVDSSDVNGWLLEAAGLHVTAKDFRTWHGSVRALDLALAACAEGAEPCTAQQVLKRVAAHLGNTVAVCRKAYVHPEVLGFVTALTDEAVRCDLRSRPWALAPPPRRGLSTAERCLVALLEESRPRRRRSTAQRA